MPTACRRWRPATRCRSARSQPTQHFTEPPPRYSEASLVKRMEELGIGRPSTYASILQVLRDRGYVRLDKKRLDSRGQGPRAHRVPGELLRAIRRIRFHRRPRRAARHDLQQRDGLAATCCATSGRTSSAAVGDIKELRITQVIDALDEMLAPHLFPPASRRHRSAQVPELRERPHRLKLGRFGGFIGCSNYPECRFTRQLTVGADGATAACASSARIRRPASKSPCAAAASAPICSSAKPTKDEDGEAVKPKRASLPKGVAPDEIDLDTRAEAARAAARDRQASRRTASRSSPASAASVPT